MILTTDKKQSGQPVGQSDVNNEKTVTTSLLGHLKKYYGVEDAREIQEMCAESTSQG